MGRKKKSKRKIKELTGREREQKNRNECEDSSNDTSFPSRNRSDARMEPVEQCASYISESKCREKRDCMFTLGPQGDEEATIQSVVSSPSSDRLSTSTSSSSIFINQNIKCKNIMVGSQNSMTDMSRPTDDDSSDEEETYSPSGARHSTGPCSESKVITYAHACTGQHISADTVNININPPESEKETSTQKQSGLFLESVQNFNRGHYILVLNRLQTSMIQNLDALLLVQWSVVFDLDPESRSSGMLSFAEHSVSRQRSLHVISWQDKDKCNFNENSLYWIGMKGYSERPGTRTDADFRKWKKQVKGSFTQILEQLRKFGESCTEFTVVSLWPKHYTEAQHMQYILEEVGETLAPKIVLVDESLSKKVEADTVLKSTLLYHEDDITRVEMCLQDVCRAIRIVCKPVVTESSSKFQLPTSDLTSDTDITDENARWLREDLDVLYINNKTGVEYTQDALETQEDTFFKGGTLPWPWWYHVGPGHVDVERDITKNMIDFIVQQHVDTYRPGCVTLLHNPGSGGTTLSQRIVWSLREKVPCAQVKHRHGLTITDLKEKVKFLSDKTRLPILLLVIGEDEQMVDSIQRVLRDKCTVIIFYVKRSRERIEKDEIDREKSRCKLKSSVSLKEARQLGLLYKKQCTTESKKEKIKELVHRVENGEKHTMFEFGLTVHSYKYTGIEPYVRDYLLLSETLQPWQKALAYLSLVYYYGQASVPCKFLAGFLGPEDADKILKFEEFPYEMQEFMVKDVQERKTNMVRITHYYVAKEILDQVLTFSAKIQRSPFPQICLESKRRLGNFAVNFIKEAGDLVKEEQSPTIVHIMTRTFILRDNKAAGENETQTSHSRRPKFSPILDDVCNRPPYTERFDILKQLTKSFSSAAQFRAHLGRLYTICRPEETDNAEECFKGALDTIFKEYESSDDLPHYIKLDLMHIYHMYGNMMLTRVGAYTGKYLGDRPKKKTPAEDFESAAYKLLPSVKQACSLFEKCRDVTPIGLEESFGYIGEIQVRLMFCSFIHYKSTDGVHRYSHNRQTEVANFIKDCYITLDELFLLCFSNTEPDKMDDDSIFNCQKWYNALFKKIPGKIVHKREESVASRRLQIAKIKMKYCTQNAYGILEQVTDASDIDTIVNEYEKNFTDYENDAPQHNVSIRIIDLDHREWLFAIRHPRFREMYSIERVLQRVEIWHDKVKSPHSRFYLFVLKSLLGFGSSKTPGDPAILTAAQQLKEDVLRQSKYVTKPRYPREWLGIDIESIRRLAPGRRFFGKIEGREVHIHGIELGKLETQKGTICAPNNKPAVGFIDLDLGSDNRVEVKVFFVPARSAGNLKGTAYNNKRVEFVLGFSLSHGYEAFNVKLLGYEACPKCIQTVEKRSCDTSVRCPRCKIEFKCKSSPASLSAAHRNGERSGLR
ncbi:sterile alpha motif domain-containing protein 9-like [Mercenaria mercenaria]|uniref:sterile alpha motif domain-containing protein 9-like n=1 Tax=Mercenaria mercenaria TaxID=6596 RepID=UPI00234EBA4A|nr:sterile alpha motif domain-containing protein 9-like [Mercenaria mercenaria]